jgi:hypothetical protein
MMSCRLVVSLRRRKKPTTVLLRILLRRIITKNQKEDKEVILVIVALISVFVLLTLLGISIELIIERNRAFLIFFVDYAYPYFFFFNFF